MGFLEWIGLKADKDTVKPIGAGVIPAYNQPPQDDVFKAYIPEFLYKPPFGYPLNKNIVQLRNLAKNPYIFSIIRTLKDEAATTKFNIRIKEEFADDKFTGKYDEKIKQVKVWFDNPNGNDESFNDIVGQWIQDLCEVDAAVGVKVFNRRKEFSQLFARDGGSFLKNPTIHGYLGNRAEFVDPIADINPNLVMPDKIKVYGAHYGEVAAYFQYGWTGNALPVPFGRREIVYICSNPRSDSIYGRSPLEVIQDVLLTLIYGAQYNNDFYINGNAPDGLINLVGADKEIVEAFQARMRDKFKYTDDTLGNSRRIGHVYPVWGGPAVNFIPFQISARDMEIIEQQKWFTKLVWSAFGVTPDEMGYTENSNKAVSQTQQGVHKRKALRPLLRKIEYMINNQIMTELDPDGVLEFVFEDYDLDEDLKKATLEQSYITMGVKTPIMVAKELGFDIDELKKQQEEQKQQEIEIAKETNPGFLPPEPKAKAEIVSDDLSSYLKVVKNKLMDDISKNGELEEIQ